MFEKYDPQDKSSVTSMEHLGVT